MTIIVMDKENWNVQTFKDVTNINLNDGVYTVTIGESQFTFQAERKILRIMES